MAFPVGAAIAAGAAIISSIISSQSSKKQAERTNQMNVDMWNRQNAYNDPSMQMARFEKAGLNPNLIYGQGNAGNAAPAPRMDAHFDPFQIPEAIGMYQDIRIKSAQADAIKAQTENTRQRTTNEAIREWLLGLQGRTGEFDLNRRSQLAPYQLEVQKGEAAKVPAQVEQEYQRLMLMRRDELNKLLEAKYREKQLSIQDIEVEQRQADLLYSKFRNQWMKAGITSSDNPLLRIFIRMMNETESGQGFQEGFKDFYK